MSSTHIKAPKITPEFSAEFASEKHNRWLRYQAQKQLGFFAKSLRPDGRFQQLDLDGAALKSEVQELHATARLVHAYSLAKLAGFPDCDAIIDAGMACLTTSHVDAEHGGYIWSYSAAGPQDTRKLNYGHVFVLLAGSSALAVGHKDAQKLVDDVTEVLETHFWDDETGLFRDEFNQDWTPFSSYRGMNSNMHGTEALLAAYEITKNPRYLEKAGRILDFFLGRLAPVEGWRIPEHFDENWHIDRAYSENPMFRPAGTTPGHSFEWARLLIQYRDLSGQKDDTALATARHLVDRAFADAWDTELGGFFYTLKFGGAPDIKDRYWWPVAEAIGVLAALLKLDPANKPYRQQYEMVWQFAHDVLIDHALGGWFPEVDANNRARPAQFIGKPDIYHSLQAVLYPMVGAVSGYYQALPALARDLNSA